MCDGGCGKVLKGSKLGKVFSSLKKKDVCEGSRLHKCVCAVIPAGCGAVLGGTCW